jgi:shikimate dehydrogenase
MRLGVAGWPVAHSRSPAIQNAALRAAGLAAWRYQLLPLPTDVFDATVTALPSCGFRGINVTIPHKERALALALRLARAAGGEVSARGLAIGAVNTLVFEPGGAIRADNTDAPALVAALPVPAAGATALVLGAGGSARSALWALLDAGAAEVRVWNRNRGRAQALCAELGGGTVVDVVEPADLLVNCTPVGLHAPPSGERDAGARELEALPIDPDRLEFGAVLDFAYRDGGGTALIRAARRQGLPAVDGLELLVGQGALAFEQFTGRAAPVAAMRGAAGLSS